MPELNTGRLNMATHLLLMSTPYGERADDLERFALIADALSNSDLDVRLGAAATVDGAYRCAAEMGWTTGPGERLVLGAIAAAVDRVDSGFTSQTATAPVVIQP